jgi:prepilin-type N-terminal cleavage/methylation domain-containing protein
MTTCDRQSGFTLLEVIIVLGVLGIVLGTAVPLAGAVVQADRRQEAVGELAELGKALDAYWFDRAAFPGSLTANDFFGVHLQPGPRNTAVLDAFANQEYRYSVAGGVATVYSLGENGVDDGANNEELVVRVHAAVPGTRRTWMRLRIAVELLAEHIESGGSVAGDWPTVRASIGLGASYDADGWGTTLQWTAATHTLTSAGPDQVFGTADDITI